MVQKEEQEKVKNADMMNAMSIMGSEQNGPTHKVNIHAAPEQGKEQVIRGNK